MADRTDSDLTVGDIRKAIEGVPDDRGLATVAWGPNGAIVIRPIVIRQLIPPGPESSLPLLVTMTIGRRH